MTRSQTNTAPTTPTTDPRTPTTDPVLSVRDVELSFAGVKALRGISFDVHDQELFAVIGPNGAGKTSIFNVLSGVYRPQVGTVTFDGNPLVGQRPHRIAGVEPAPHDRGGR